MATTTQPVSAISDAVSRGSNSTVIFKPLNLLGNQQTPLPQDTVTINAEPAAFQAVQAPAAATEVSQHGGAAGEFVPFLPNSAPPNPAPAAAPDSGAIAVNNANTSSVRDVELAQLGKTLQQLGIPPSTIPQIQQIAMLLDRFDPQALLQFLKALQGVAAQAGSQAAAPAAPPQTSATANPLPVVAQTIAAQFQELQQSFNAIGLEQPDQPGAAAQADSSGAAAPASANPPGSALNIRA